MACSTHYHRDKVSACSGRDELHRFSPSFKAWVKDITICNILISESASSTCQTPYQRVGIPKACSILAPPHQGPVPHGSGLREEGGIHIASAHPICHCLSKP